VLVHSDGVLGLVEDRLASASVCGIILGAAKLVGSRLTSGFVGVGDDRTRNLVGGTGDTLLKLLASGLGGVGLHALLGLVAEILTSEVRHVD